MNLNELVEIKNQSLKPLVVCHIGSTTKARDAFEHWRLQDTLAGHIVLTIGAAKSGTSLALTDEQKRQLDVLHLYKIDLCDFVRVLNVDDYIGESTAREIVYALQHEKPCVFLEPTACCPLSPCHSCGHLLCYDEHVEWQRVWLRCGMCEQVTCPACIRHCCADEDGVMMVVPISHP